MRRQLKRIPEAGGLAQDICDGRTVGGAWSPNGTILFGAFQGTLPGAGLRWPAGAGDSARRRAGAPHPWLAGVPAGWPTLPVLAFSEIVRRQRSIRERSNDGHSPGRARQIPCRGDGRTPSVALQGSARRPAVRPGECASRRRVNHNRRPHRVRYPAARRSVSAAADRVVAFRSATQQSTGLGDRMATRSEPFPRGGLVPSVAVSGRHAYRRREDGPASARHTIWIIDVARGTASRLLDDRAAPTAGVVAGRASHPLRFEPSRRRRHLPDPADGSAPDTLVHRRAKATLR